MEQSVSLLGLATALGIGLLIGVEREKSHGPAGDRTAGVRTFALVALLGALGAVLGGNWGVGLAALVAAAFAVTPYLRAAPHDLGLTTEVALVLTAALGGLAMTMTAMAAGLGVLVALLLVSRDWLHGIVRERLSEQEVTDAVLLAAAALVVLPLLPDRAIDPYGVVNPRTVWKLAVVVMAINAAGYVAVRALGARAGLPVAGLAGGFVSSAATIGAMAQTAAQTPPLARAAVAGAAMSSIATVVQLAVLVFIAYPPLLAALWPSLAGAGLVAVAYGAAFSWHALRVEGAEEARLGRAFQPKTAVIFALTVTAVLFLAAILQHQLGEFGSLTGLTLAGFADAHAPAISAASLARSGDFTSATALLAVLLAFSTNTVTKAIVATTTGGASFALRLVPGLFLMLLAAWLGALPLLRAAS